MKFSTLGLLIQVMMTMMTVVSSSTTKLSKHEIKSLQKKDGIVRLTDANYDSVVAGPRDYTLAVLLTAEGPQYNCAFCNIVGPAVRKVAANWYRDNSKNKDFFFVIADVATAPSTFQRLGLQSAPNLYIYDPTEKSEPATSGYRVQKFDPVEEQIGPLQALFSELTGTSIHIKEPFRYDRLLGTIGAVGFVSMTSYQYSELIVKFLQSKQLWVAFTFVSVLMFTCGHMFNIIRHSPYIIGNGNGGITYFTGGQSNQIAVETQIMAVAYAVGAFSVISMITKAPKISDPKFQAILVVALVFIVFLAESFIMAKFNIKNGSYPFKLLNIF